MCSWSRAGESKLNSMKGEDGGAGIQNKLQRISRANSIGGDSSIYGGVSELDTNKFLRDQPPGQNIFVNPNAGQNSHQSH